MKGYAMDTQLWNEYSPVQLAYMNRLYLQVRAQEQATCLAFAQVGDRGYIAPNLPIYFPAPIGQPGLIRPMRGCSPIPSTMRLVRVNHWQVVKRDRGLLLDRFNARFAMSAPSG